jgi:Holliday junction resolvase RusA-like endonuclease
MYGRAGGRVYLKPAARAAKEAIGWEARAQYRGDPLRGDLAITVSFFWPDRRKHDHDNAKVFYDALNGIVWEDDGQITDATVRRRYDPTNPRVELEVLQLNQPAPI